MALASGENHLIRVFTPKLDAVASAVCSVAFAMHSTLSQQGMVVHQVASFSGLSRRFLFCHGWPLVGGVVCSDQPLLISRSLLRLENALRVRFSAE